MITNYNVNDDIKRNGPQWLSRYFHGGYQFGTYYLQVTVKEQKNSMNILLNISFSIPVKKTHESMKIKRILNDSLYTNHTQVQICEKQN